MKCLTTKPSFLESVRVKLRTKDYSGFFLPHNQPSEVLSLSLPHSLPSFLLSYFTFFETVFHDVAQVRLKFCIQSRMTLNLHLSPFQCWDYKQILPCPLD